MYDGIDIYRMRLHGMEQSQHHLSVTATGNHNPDSKGTEIWLRALRYADGSTALLESFEAGEGWAIREEGADPYLVYSGRAPSELRWSGTAIGPMELVLGAHEWSGIARVNWNGRESEVDLYATGGYRVIALPVEGDGAMASHSEERRQRILPTQRNAALFTGESPRLWLFLNPRTMLRELTRHRYLIWQFTIREMMGRYKGSFFGFIWSFLTPLLLLAVYTFVFGVVFKGRWGQAGEHKGIADFALKMFCGLIVFNIFSECVNRAPGVIVYNQNYVKKVVFPLEIFPVSVLGSALIHGLISLAILVAGQALFLPEFPYSLAKVYYLPLVLLPLVMMVLGLGWFLSSLGVFIRDIGHAIMIAVQVLFYVTPVFYPIEALPEWARGAVRMNPLATVVADARKVLIFGERPSLRGWLTVTLVSFVIMQLGYAWFMKTKKGFADVI